MRKRWSQRNAWIVWIVASLIGWASIFALYTIVNDSGDTSFASKSSGGGDLTPATGPSTTEPKQ